MSSNSMALRSGRILGPPGPPPAVVAPPAPIPAPFRLRRPSLSPTRDPATGIPPAPFLPGLILPVPAPNTFLGIPQPLRMAILDEVFQGRPRTQVEGHLRPHVLARLCLVSRMLRDEATEAYLRVTPFQVRILSAFPDFDFYHTWVNRGQGPPPVVFPGRYLHTMNDFRRRVSDAQLLIPSARSFTYGAQGRIRMARSAGEFPWGTCPEWLQNTGPFIRDIQFDIIYPLPCFPPMTKPSRSRRLRWDHIISGTLSMQVVSPGAALVTQEVVAQWPPAPLPPGLGAQLNGIPGIRRAGPTNPLNPHPYQGQCQRAVDEANRLRSAYLPAAPPPGTPGFTGFTLRDLRQIAKAFSEPSIYVIQD